MKDIRDRRSRSNIRGAPYVEITNQFNALSTMIRNRISVRENSKENVDV